MTSNPANRRCFPHSTEGICIWDPVWEDPPPLFNGLVWVADKKKLVKFGREAFNQKAMAWDQLTQEKVEAAAPSRSAAVAAFEAWLADQ